MKKWFKKNVIVIIVIIILLLLLSFVIYTKMPRKYTFNPDYTKYEEVTKNYGINEYVVLSMNSEQMSKIYFANFKSYLIYNIEEAYNMIDEKYRSLKFSNIDNFKNYVYKLNIASSKIKKYKTSIGETKSIYYIYDNYDNYYIFKAEGIMDYKVYFDDTTVEI